MIIITLPLIYPVAGDATNIALDPLFMFVFRLGVSGAAIAHVISQYVLFNCNSNVISMEDSAKYFYADLSNKLHCVFLLLLLILIILCFQINCVGT